MAAISTHINRVYSAKTHLKSLTLPDTYLYLGIGRITPWTSNDGPNVTEFTPPYPSDTVKGHYDVWRDVMHAKLVNPNDCSLVVPRYNWTSGIIYTQYDHNTDLFDNSIAPFYVITDDLNVYKCLYNNNNSPAWAKPYSRNKIVATADKYIWKYMFTVDTLDAEKFLTSEWIPVKTLTEPDSSEQWNVQQFASNGIDIIQVVNPGIGYIGEPLLTITGDGKDASAKAITRNGKIESIVVTNSGSGYSYANATITSGQVTQLTILDGGTGYSSPPTISISGGGGNGAFATCEITNGSITKVTVTQGGTGYTSLPAVTVGGNATLVAVISSGAQFKPIVSPPNGHGSDPETELGAGYLMIRSAFNYDEGGFMIDNNFRTLCLIYNPRIWESEDLCNDSMVDQSWTLHLTITTANFVPNDFVTGSVSGATGYILDLPDANTLRLVGVKGRFDPSDFVTCPGKTGAVFETTASVLSATLNTVTINDPNVNGYYDGYTLRVLTGKGSGQIRTIVTDQLLSGNHVLTLDDDWDIVPDTTSTMKLGNIGYPRLKPNSGYLLQIENRRPIMRSSEQTEDIRIVFAL